MSEHDDIELARRVALVIGPSSAAAQAVAHYERMREAGETPICIAHNRSWLVMPLTAWMEVMDAR